MLRGGDFENFCAFFTLSQALASRELYLPTTTLTSRRIDDAVILQSKYYTTPFAYRSVRWRGVECLIFAGTPRICTGVLCFRPHSSRPFEKRRRLEAQYNHDSTKNTFISKACFSRGLFYLVSALSTSTWYRYRYRYRYCTFDTHQECQLQNVSSSPPKTRFRRQLLQKW